MNLFHRTDFEKYNEFMSIEEVAETLHISNFTLRNKISKGEDLPENFRIGRRRLFPKSSLIEWLEKQRQNALQDGV